LVFGFCLDSVFISCTVCITVSFERKNSFFYGSVRVFLTVPAFRFLPEGLLMI